MKFKNYDTEILSRELLEEISSASQASCLSLYQSTNRKHQENLQDSIQFRSLIKDLEKSLLQKYSTEDTQTLLEPFETLTRDSQFWNYTLDGLAVFSSPNYFRTVRIPSTLTNLAIVSDSFHMKPLHRFLQSVDRYQVLGVSLHHTRLFEGNRYALDEIELIPEVPQKIEEILGEIDAEKYFRAVDRAILEHYSKPSGLPLILAALPEHHHLFQRISHNSHLTLKGIELNPDAISIAELQKLAWQVIEPIHKTKLVGWRADYANARSKKIASDDLVQVAQAAAAGRVKTLLIEVDRQIAGRLDAASGKIEFDDLSNPEVDDLLDDLGELVEKMKGQVQVVHAKHMPSKTGLAAIYRY